MEDDIRPIKRLIEDIEADFPDGQPTALQITTDRQRRAFGRLTRLEDEEALAYLRTLTPPGMVFVPAGPFIMGSERWADAQPVQEIWVDTFYISRYPVTNGQYRQFIEGRGYRRREYWTTQGWEWVEGAGKAHPAYHWAEARLDPDLPVVGVCWHEAVAYARWSGTRLLTEVEWEKAARGSDGRRYPWGNKFDQSKCNTFETGAKHLKGLMPVGRHSPEGDSPHGVADMAGNAWEWISSLYRPYPYRADDGREDLEATGGKGRGLRGGAWNCSKIDACCAYRDYNDPYRDNFNYGFRVGWGATPGQDWSAL